VALSLANDFFEDAMQQFFYAEVVGEYPVVRPYMSLGV
jgi:hypothetical protein